MALYEISDSDAGTIKAILMTHAEMQDARSVESMELIGRLKRDDPKDGAELIDDLEDQVETFDDDCDDLRRIAGMFQVA